jgi:hypothetical protein
MKIIISLLIITFSLNVFGQEALCKKIESQGEGHWPIPEEAFTKERAQKALKTLEDFTAHGSMGADYVKAENELMFIKGYMLKTFLDPKDKVMLNEYCAFIENEAYVRH